MKTMSRPSSIKLSRALMPRRQAVHATRLKLQQQEIFEMCRPSGATVADTAEPVRCPGSQPRLQTHFHGHQAAITDCILLKDQVGRLECATASMDKTLRYWRIDEADDEAVTEPIISVQTLNEGPVFALAKDTYTQDRPQSLLCGTSNKDVIVWVPPSASILSRKEIVMDGHSGWVRALAMEGRWLFSCGCNQLVQWDLAWPQPRRVNQIDLFTGDIQCIATTETRVFAACTKGVIHAWDMDEQGMLSDAGQVVDAHSDRVLALHSRGDYLYSTGADGAIKAWRCDTLELTKTVEGAHDGAKITCAAVTSDADSCAGFLYTGGADNNVRVWQLPDLIPSCAPLTHHQAPVRALSTSINHVLSADAAGCIALWDVSAALDTCAVPSEFEASADARGPSAP